MDRAPSKKVPAYSQEVRVPAMLRVRGDQIIGIEDHQGNVLGVPVTVADGSGAEDWQTAICQRDADGNLCVLMGVRADGTFFAGGINAPGTSSDMHHIVLHGQSNAMADESYPVISKQPTGWGGLRFVRGVKTWTSTDNPETPTARAASDFALTDLTAQTVETRANALADAYKARLVGASRFSALDVISGPRVMISSASLGGRKLSEVGPEDSNAGGVRRGAGTYGGHWATLLDDIRRAQAAAASAGLRYAIAGMNYDQGESEGDLTLYYGEAARTQSQIISGYAAMAKTMVETFDTQARAITKQLRPIPTFVTPACFNALTPTAWMDVSDLTPLCVIVGPRYQMPSARNASNGLTGGSQAWGNEIHHSPDGHRWVGEMVAKVMHRVINEGEAWKPLRALSARKISATQIDVEFHVPRPPLVLDVTLIAQMQGWGFELYAGTVDAKTNKSYPTAIEIVDGRVVRLTFAAIPAGARLSMGVTSACTAALTHTVAAVAAGAATANGFSTWTVSIAGDVRADFAALLNDGVFYAYGNRPSRYIVRGVSFDGTNTVLSGEDREIRSDGGYLPILAGNTLTYGRMFPATNLRDSDSAASLNTFVAGSRAGQLYPLHNWACQYDALSVIGA